MPPLARVDKNAPPLNDVLNPAAKGETTVVRYRHQSKKLHIQ
jgi:hypothetical protein